MVSRTNRFKKPAVPTSFSGEEEILAHSDAEHPGESTRSTTAAVLIAEDEEIVRTVAAITLERAGFLVLPACNGEAAIEMFRHGGVKVDALLTDVQMGNGINGIALAELILNERPETPVLVMSGFPGAELLAREKNLRFLAKPFTAATLVEQMRQALASNAPAPPETPRMMKAKRTQS